MCETICSFLNTNGGYILCGIREKNHEYHFSGFDRSNESKLIDICKSQFYDDNGKNINVSDSVSFSYEVIENTTIAVITIRPLSNDRKYIQYENNYYERVLSQDRKINTNKLNAHKDYKIEYEYSKELSPVERASIEDLSLDNVNLFITKVNQSGNKETIKSSLENARDYLRRKYCITDEGKVTTLGLLLFGSEPSVYLENKASVDCYYDTTDSLGRDKKYIQGNVIELMDSAFYFIWNHIKVGRTYVGGGASVPEFPEDLIREVINNAIAHRDYSINRFATIKVNPGENITISNPGTFKQRMTIEHLNPGEEIRRIVPGIAESKNPKLANILKTLDKVESQGFGMATLVNLCLKNKVDVPYFDLSFEHMITLVVPTGTLLDEATERWLSSFNEYIQSKLKKPVQLEHRLVLAYLYKSQLLNQRRYHTIHLSENNNHFEVLSDLKNAGLIYQPWYSSDERTPVYFVNQVFVKTDYSVEIEKSTGVSLSQLSTIHQAVANILYRNNYFNSKALKPSLVTPEVYFATYGKRVNPKEYESLGRKVRKVCADLLKDGVLEKNPDGSYFVKHSLH